MMPTFEFVPGKLSCLRGCLPIFPLILAGLWQPAMGSAQIRYTGAAANQNFGSQAIGSTSAATTFSFSVAAGTTVGSIGVLTQGAPNLDFANASGSTCAAMTYASATTCTFLYGRSLAMQRKYPGSRPETTRSRPFEVSAGGGGRTSASSP